MWCLSFIAWWPTALLHSDSRRKAEILNQQFCSVFTDEDTTNMPKLEGPPTTPMNNIEITQSGITKLLSELNVDKAPGPDELPNLLLKNAAKEISPFLTDIFEHYPDREITRWMGRG